MSRKHFEALAAALAALKGITPTKAHEIARRDCCIAVAAVCASTNNAFDRSRFLKACGVES